MQLMRRSSGPSIPQVDKPSVDTPDVKKEKKSKPWLFLLCAWACYMRYVSNNWVQDSQPTHNLDSPVDHSFIEVEEIPSPPQDVPKTALIVEKSGLALSALGDDSVSSSQNNPQGQSESKAEGPEVEAGAAERAPDQGEEMIDDDGKGDQALPMIGATLALSGKCASPDYGTRIFYIKTKHTGSGKLAGILRRIGYIHNMEVVDPPRGANSFRDETDFHRVAQGRCVDLLVAHTQRAPWLDKAFKGSLKFTSVMQHAYMLC
jgi:hypothetical protein